MVLEEQVELAVVVDQPVGVVEPSPPRREVVAGAHGRVEAHDESA
jgi:hypothetical protein